MTVRHPCTKCPWRRDAPLKIWSDSDLQHMYLECQDDGFHTMCCHVNMHLPVDDPRIIPCMGWARVLKFEAIGVRLSAMNGRLEIEDIESTEGPELYSSFDEMLIANEIELPPRNRVTRKVSR